MIHRLAPVLLLAAAATAATFVAPAPQYPQPTEKHAQILEQVGTWEGTLTSLMPGAPGEPAAARETMVAVGGFWIQSTFQCDFMGMPYTGTGCVGYDESRGKYVGTWVDSMSSYLAVMEGEVDEDKGALVMRWEAPDPESGKMVPHWSETVHGEDRYTSTFYMGEGVKTMVIDMKRKSARPVDAGAGR